MSSKKGVSMPWETIVIFVILGVFLLLVTQAMFYPDSGLLWRAGNAASELVGMVPKPELKQPNRPTLDQIDPKVKKAMDGIFDALVAAKNANAPCIIKYEPTELESYVFNLYSDGKDTWLDIKQEAGIGERGTAYDTVVPGVSLCVVAGKTDTPRYASSLTAVQRSELDPEPSTIVAENFYNNWIPDKRAHGPFRLPEYNDVLKIKVGYKAPWFWFNNNGIVAYDKSGKFVVGGEEGNTLTPQDLEDGGLLYVPEKGKVCFLATFGGDSCCNADTSGLDNACFDESNSCSLLFSDYTIYNSDIPRC